MEATGRCATQRGLRASFGGATPPGRKLATRPKKRRAKRLTRHARLFARRADVRHLAREGIGLARHLPSLACKPSSLARRAESFAHRVAAHRARSKKPCEPSRNALRTGLLGLHTQLSSLRAALSGLRAERTGWHENARARLGSVNGHRYSAGDANTNKWGRCMGACAWVLGRVGTKTAALGKPALPCRCRANGCVHCHPQVHVNQTNTRQGDPLI